MRTIVLLVSLALSSVAVSDTLYAQPAAGDDAYTQARELYGEEKYDQALTLFRQVTEQLDSPNARLYVARCLAKLGRNIEAYTEMATTVRDASKRAKSEARFAATRDAAIQELDRIEKMVGRITIELNNASGDVTIQIDETPVENLDYAIGVEPGSHFVTARSADGERVEQSVDLRPGDAKTLVLSFKSSEPEPASDDTAEVDTSGDGSSLPIAGGVLAGLGAAGMVVFAVTGSMANSKLSELEDSCGEGPCSDPAFDETVDDGQQLQTIANVSVIVGGVALAAGAALLIAGLVGGGDAAQTGLIVAPTAEGGFVGYRARF